jgi:hypothetical protein
MKGAIMRKRITMQELFETVQQITHSDAEAVAVIVHMIATGYIVLPRSRRHDELVQARAA